MAGRRLAKSAVDWTAFAERVPPAQKDYYRAFKARSDNFINRVHQFPENLPNIDFALYKRALATPALAEQFEKAYKGLSIPYPKDKSNIASQVDQEKSQADVQSKTFVADLQKDINAAKQMLNRLDKVPKPSEMTMEMYDQYFPDKAMDPANPTFWPHTPEYQPSKNKDILT